MSAQKQTEQAPEKPKDPYQKYKDFKWQNPDQFKNGPIDDESRKCRDCVCCIIFILLFALFIVVAAFGFWKGQPSKLLYFYDDTGHACGHDEGYENYPYLYFTSVISGLVNFDTDQLINVVCVSSCPNVTLDPKDYEHGEKFTLDCKADDENKCKIDYKDYYESKIFINRICFPKTEDEIHYNSTIQYLASIYDPETGDVFKKVLNKKDIYNDTSGATPRVYIAQDAINGETDSQKASAKLINLSYFTQLFTLWINDLYVTRYAILASIGWTFFLAMFYFLFLRCCAGFIYFLFDIIGSSRINSISSLLLLFA